MGKLIAEIISLLFMITSSVFDIWYAIKCRGVEECHNQKCIYRLSCYSYREQDILTLEEAEELLAHWHESKEDQKADVAPDEKLLW